MSLKVVVTPTFLAGSGGLASYNSIWSRAGAGVPRAATPAQPGRRGNAMQQDQPRNDPRREGFRFDPDKRPPRVPDQQILETLRRFAKSRKGKRMRRRDFKAWKQRTFSAETTTKRFGSWHKALIAAGLPGAHNRRHTPEDLINILERVWLKLGYAPSVTQMARLERICDSPFRRIWGSFSNARRQLAAWKEGRISREDLLTPTTQPKERRRAPLSASKRLRVLMRDGQRCVICGQGAKDGAVLEVDHIVPVCRGGGDGMENLRTLCRDCNRGRRDDAE